MSKNKENIETDEVPKPSRFEGIIYGFVWLSFALPIAYLIFRLAFPNLIHTTDRADTDYILMLVECILGLVVIHIPSFIEKTFKIDVPAPLFIAFMLFLYCAIFLGEVRNFYFVVPHWDVVLHGFSSIMAGFFGFMVVSIINKNEKIRVNLSPLFVSLFAFCFAVTIGTVWEIYEFSFDGILGLNMQKFALENGKQLVGHLALVDTMKDIIVDCIGAFTASLLGYFSIKNGKGWFAHIVKGPKRKGNKKDVNRKSKRSIQKKRNRG